MDDLIIVKHSYELVYVCLCACVCVCEWEHVRGSMELPAVFACLE